jgi:predicted outer membrane repeat protein
VQALFYAAAFGSTFVDNVATLVGGAISGLPAEGFGGGVPYGGVFSVNSTFVGNSAEEAGGAIVAQYGQIGLSTFLNNETNGASGDELGESDSVFVFSEAVDTMQLAGNIFAGSRSRAQLGSFVPDSYEDLGGNVFSTPATTEVALGTPDASSLFSRSVSEIFGPDPVLANNGASTLTQTVALVAGSPAIDAVPEGAVTFFAVDVESAAGFASADELMRAARAFSPAFDSPDFDQRDVERTGLADAGAYEYGDAEIADGSELAATGPDESASSWLAALAALLFGLGASIFIGARRIARTDR